LPKLKAKNGAPLSQAIFKIGDRVRLNELGNSRSPRLKGQVGAVVLVRSRYSVDVLFDGNKTPTAIHCSYIEADDPEVQI
jgi:hypothetical protein